MIVLGGGVAGLSAAHELIERGFEVTVYEARERPGGKARSMPVPGSGSGGRGDLPGEHGFRFFPGFYRHLPETMSRIPYEGQSDGVLGNLVQAGRVQVARSGGSEIVAPAHFPRSLDELHLAFRALFTFAADAGVAPDEQLHFADRLLLFLSSCEKRRFAEYEHQSWWSFSGAEERSPAYGKFLADGLTRTLVAAKAREISARTGGAILLQLLFDLSRPGAQADRVLAGRATTSGSTPGSPTCEGWGWTTASGIRCRRCVVAAGGSPAWASPTPAAGWRTARITTSRPFPWR